MASVVAYYLCERPASQEEGNKTGGARERKNAAAGDEWELVMLLAIKLSELACASRQRERERQPHNPLCNFGVLLILQKQQQQQKTS